MEIKPGQKNLCLQRNALGITEFNTQVIKFPTSKHFSIREAVLILFEEYRSLMNFRDHYLFCLFKRFRFPHLVKHPGQSHVILKDEGVRRGSRASEQVKLLLFFVAMKGIMYSAPNAESPNTMLFFLTRNKTDDLKNYLLPFQLRVPVGLIS